MGVMEWGIFGLGILPLGAMPVGVWPSLITFFLPGFLLDWKKCSRFGFPNMFFQYKLYWLCFTAKWDFFTVSVSTLLLANVT